MAKIEPEGDVPRLNLRCSLYTKMIIARIESIHAKSVNKANKVGVSSEREFVVLTSNSNRKEQRPEFGVRIVYMRLYVLIDIGLSNAEEGNIREEVIVSCSRAMRP